MYREIGGQHKTPHIHAEYQGEEVVVSLEGDVIEGSIPKKKQSLVIAWVNIHYDDLLANWDLLEKGEKTFTIEPLK
jgi:hypothetical protein